VVSAGDNPLVKRVIPCSQRKAVWQLN